MDAEKLNLGSLITNQNQKRDAVHIAVIPAVSSVNVKPGDWVCFVMGARENEVMPCSQSSYSVLGIVDPFLWTKLVRPGDEFWVFLIPGSITGLRHDWSNNFVTAAEIMASQLAVKKEEQYEQSYAPVSAEFQPALKALCREAADLGVTLEELLEAANNYQETGEYFYRGSSFDGAWISDDFWHNYEIVTGKFAANKDNFFSCSC